jgi:predicted nucleic acid-binding protein
VRVILDANIAFSGILSTNGRIGDLLINSAGLVDFIAPNFLRTEIKKHYPKLIKLSNMTLEEIRESEFQLYSGVTFISEEQIKVSTWLAAQKLVADVDVKDTVYIAFARHFRCKIWSGDKHLRKGLEKKGFKNFITTEELFNWREKKNRG